MSSPQDFYFAEGGGREERYSVPLDGKTISIGPFPFRPRSIVLVNQTKANMIATDDRGEQYIAAQSIGATYGTGDSIRFSVALDVAQTSGKATVVVSDQPAGIAAAQLSSFAGVGGSGVLPAGVIVPWPVPLAPSWAVIADGTHYDGTIPKFQALWAVIGNSWGGASQADMAVPDCRDRVLVGVSGTKAITSVGGEATHVLTVAELASHAHGVSDPTHAHNVPTDTGAGAQLGGAARATSQFAGSITDAQPTGISIVANGGGGAHNNMQPYVAIPFIISLGG